MLLLKQYIARFSHSTFKESHGFEINEAYQSNINRVTVDNSMFELGLKTGVIIDYIDASTNCYN